MKATTAMLALYRALTGLGQPLAGHLLTTRARRGKEDPARLTERLGEASRLRPPGALVWIHGVSVGESLSSLPLVEALLTRRPNLTILVTCATLTAAQLLSERLPKGVIHQFVPIDTPQATGAFMRHWQPDLAVLVEGELWPNLITAAKASGARLALISARMTQKSARGWHGLARSAKALLGQFDLILAQDQDSKARLEALGANVAGLANLKTLALPLAYSAADLGHLRGQIGQRPVLLAASTHLGEDEIVLRAFKALTVWPDQPKPLLILAPRHPVRGADLEQTVADLGFSAARRSISQPIAPTTEVYIADTLGEMGLFYRLATLTIMGGSLVSGIGGHNPLEPARLGAAMVSGDQVFNFAQVYADMAKIGGLVLVPSEADLMSTLSNLVQDGVEAKAMAAKALAYCAREAKDMDTLWTGLEPLLPPRAAKAASL